MLQESWSSAATAVIILSDKDYQKLGQYQEWELPLIRMLTCRSGYKANQDKGQGTKKKKTFKF